ncbi:MAG: NAD(P)H-binding protein [Pirellulaceae bacterium]|nr:NAD(P)H-binding protein [Pirellulaceae bacterium]
MMTNSPRCALIAGCGYLGSRVAKIWSRQQLSVHAVTRSDDRAAEFSRQGWRPIKADFTHTVAALPEVDTVLWAVGFDRAAGYEIEEIFVDGLQRCCDALPASVRRFIYVSSTGVYSQSDGEWIDESSVCAPQRPAAAACLAAEKLLADRFSKQQLVVLRAAGLYGPGRLPHVELIRRGDPVPAADGYLNLIHVDDAARIVGLTAAHPSPPRLICVSDDEPCTRGDYYRELARRIGAPPPQFTAPAPPAADRASSNKKVSNRLLREVYGQVLSYPTFRDGIDNILRADGTES